jgi:hypothetical protein
MAFHHILVDSFVLLTLMRLYLSLPDTGPLSDLGSLMLYIYYGRFLSRQLSSCCCLALLAQLIMLLVLQLD